MYRWFTAGLILALAACAPAAPDTTGKPEIEVLLGRIKKVGREGTGNVEAGKAWKALVAKGSPALVPILLAMNDDELTSANWLRPAFEHIAERTLKDGKSLPKADLEKFLAKTSHSGSARRIAYEWLVKIDKTTPDRLLPGMLLDPSPELRRDAVARAIKEAQTSLDKKDEANAKQLFQRALTGACDQDQVDTIAKALATLGLKIDLQAHFGVVRSWHLIAPFEHTKDSGWKKVYPPEKGVDLKQTYRGKGEKDAKWLAHDTTDPYGVVDLNKTLGKMKGTVAYAFAVVHSPKERVIELRMGSPNGLKVFLNGKEVFARDEYHHGAHLDQYTARSTLKAGRNEILLKVCQNEQTEGWAQEWKFQLRLCDFVGSAVPFTQAKTNPKEAR
jgi:hypothetical protein